MKARRRPPSRRSAAQAGAGGARPPTYEDLLRIVHLVESTSRFSEFRLRSGDIEVEIRRANGAAVPAAAHAEPRAGAAEPRALVADPQGGEVTLEPGLALVRAPMVGTFYRAPEPGARPFVEPGSRVAPDTVVCIIEVMKLMSSVSAGVAGVVQHVLVENARPVEFGQALIAIRPDA